MDKIIGTAAILLLAPLALGLQCQVDEKVGWEDPNNLYTCRDNEKCCTEDAKPTCCAEMDENEAIMKQVKLWCGVIGVIVVFGLLMWYARWDGQCCDEDTHCCSCCKPKDSGHAGHHRADNMGPPPDFHGGAKPRQSESSRDLLSYQDE